MVFDDDTPPRVELSLGGKKMWRLAERMTQPPSPQLQAAIIAAAEARVRRLSRVKLSPYRLHASLQGDWPELSPAQVAYVLVMWLQVPR
jgi:hypothetical protein